MESKNFDLKRLKQCKQPHCNHLRVQDLSKSPTFMTLLCQHFMHTCNLVVMLALEKCLHGNIMLNCFIYEHDCERHNDEIRHMYFAQITVVIHQD